MPFWFPTSAHYFYSFRFVLAGQSWGTVIPLVHVRIVPVKPAGTNKATKWLYSQFLKGSVYLAADSKSPQQELTLPRVIAAHQVISPLCALHPGHSGCQQPQTQHTRSHSGMLLHVDAAVMLHTGQWCALPSLPQKKLCPAQPEKAALSPPPCNLHSGECNTKALDYTVLPQDYSHCCLIRSIERFLLRNSIFFMK